MKILIASDRESNDLKNNIISYTKNNYNNDFIIDGGSIENSNINYSIICRKIFSEYIKYIKNEKISPFDEIDYFLILITKTGIEISIAANKYKEIRAILCNNLKIAEISRIFNNSNVICLGSKINNQNEIENFIKIFLKTKFNNGQNIPKTCSN